MRRLSINLNIEFGQAEPDQERTDTQADALVEHGDPEPSSRHELDGRRGSVGFGDVS